MRSIPTRLWPRSAVVATCAAIGLLGSTSLSHAIPDDPVDPPTQGEFTYSVKCVPDSSCPFGKKWKVTFDWDEPGCREVHVWYDFDGDSSGPPNPGDGWYCEPFGLGLGCQTFTEEFCGGEYGSRYDGEDCVQFWLEWRGYENDDPNLPYTIGWTEIDHCFDENDSCLTPQSGP